LPLWIIRIIDRYAGIVLCGILTAWRRLVQAAGREAIPGKPPNKILFIKLSEQGATVLAHAAIRRAVTMCGRENVYFMVFSGNERILEIMDPVPGENIFIVRYQHFTHFTIDVLQSLAQIRRIGIDAAVDMELFARISVILAYLSGAKQRSGHHRFTSEGPWRGDLLTHRVQYNPYLHISQQYDLLVCALLADSATVPMMKTRPEPLSTDLPVFTPAAAETEKITQLLAHCGIDPEQRRIVLFNPRSGEELFVREWPADAFSALAWRLLDSYVNLTIVLTGMPEDRALAEKIIRNTDKQDIINLAGQLTLRELLTLYTMSAALVTADSGPAHFSGLTKLPALVLFGPETPALYGPLSPRTRVIATDLACSPCLTAYNHRHSPCTDNQCMKKIQVDSVFNAVRDMLDHPQD
jgi:ADP-heptose:LPS heptosyltransferase